MRKMPKPVRAARPRVVPARRTRPALRVVAGGRRDPADLSSLILYGQA